MVQKSWQKAVYEACLSQANMNNHIFTRRDLTRNSLEKIKIDTQSKAIRADQSMSRVLQELRDNGFIKFISCGKYQMVQKDINLALMNSKRMSKGEKLVAQILDEFQIDYKQESTHSDLKCKGYLRFDFEIDHDSRKFVIEVDGEQHYRPIEYFGGLKAFKHLQICDKIKDDYCTKTGRIMMRIKPQELKYDKVKDKIAELLNLNEN